MGTIDRFTVELHGAERDRYIAERFPKKPTRPKAPSRSRHSLGTNEFRDGKTRVASSWRAVDWSGDESKFRDVYHYSTLMGRFVLTAGRWVPIHLSVGHGSVSDQHGMNQILDGLGVLNVSYRRDGRGGGPRYVDTVSQETVV